MVLHEGFFFRGGGVGGGGGGSFLCLGGTSASLYGACFVPSNLILEEDSLHRRSFTSFAKGNRVLLCKTGNHLRSLFHCPIFCSGTARHKVSGKEMKETEKMIGKGSMKTE